MTFQDLFVKLRALKVDESRAGTEEYFEAVVSKAGLAPLCEILEGYFGAPAKPEGQAPSGEAIQNAAPYGGIRKDQIMYFRQDGEYSECALLWPWGSGTRITVKVIRSKESDPGAGGWADRLKNIFFRRS